MSGFDSINEAFKKTFGGPMPMYMESDHDFAIRERAYRARTWTLDEEHELALAEERWRSTPPSEPEDDSASGCLCPHCTGSHEVDP